MKKPKLLPGDEVVMRRAVRGTDIQKNDHARVIGYDAASATYRLRFGRFKNAGRDSMKPVNLPRKNNFELFAAGRETLRKSRKKAAAPASKPAKRAAEFKIDRGLELALTAAGAQQIVLAIRELTRTIAAAWIPGVYPPDRTGRLPLFDRDAANG